MTDSLQTMPYSERMKEAQKIKTPTANGARLAAFRKAAGFSQVQLAGMIGIPQRTLSFYETGAENLPSGLVPALAQALGVTVEEILGIPNEKTTKRGPKSKLERQLDAVRRLPRGEQDFVSKFLDNVLVQHTVNA